MWKWIGAITLLIGFIILNQQVESCNEAVCGSIVSKCLLTQSCKCELKNCTCCKECFSCLSDLFSECCSCVDMCPKPIDTGSSLSKKSHVEDFPDSDQIKDLFKLLTEEPDPQDRWTSYTYPIDIDTTQFSPKKEMKLHLQSTEQQHYPLNCTVAFMSSCMSWEKCKNNCLSMGSASYRWFHDGCCECVGGTCINYGINESRCRKCSFQEEDNLDDLALTDDDLDYGESEELEED